MAPAPMSPIRICGFVICAIALAHPAYFYEFRHAGGEASINVGTCGLDTVERQSEHGTQASGKTDPTI